VAAIVASLPPQEWIQGKGYPGWRYPVPGMSLQTNPSSPGSMKAVKGGRFMVEISYDSGAGSNCNSLGRVSIALPGSVSNSAACTGRVTFSIGLIPSISFSALRRGP